MSLRNLKLKLPDEYTISSFQLVPETTAGAASRPDTDSDKDTLKLRWWKADALKLETGEVMETKAQLESELKKTYRESLRNLKLKLPDEYTISSFQLVPETTAGAASLPDSDSDKDTL
ncbi:hypothetical protein DY000_02044529 [Brassica cretica]|uniref:Uncharacterized protein n=1 Tax=Brassica cretica TaxID=69181 RepID=A0ABQ7F785_BRACR|nr:hypothetical protein DY000_02044529 [Brassica cretica]